MQDLKQINMAGEINSFDVEEEKRLTDQAHSTLDKQSSLNDLQASLFNSFMMHKKSILNPSTSGMNS